MTRSAPDPGWCVQRPAPAVALTPLFASRAARCWVNKAGPLAPPGNQMVTERPKQP